MVTERLMHHLGTFGSNMMLKVSSVCGLVSASL